MAWIKFKDPMGKEFTVPESVFRNMFAGNSAFTLVQESKPAPKVSDEKPADKVEEIESETNQEIKEEEIVKDEQVSRPSDNEKRVVSKGSKKVG